MHQKHDIYRNMSLKHYHSLSELWGHKTNSNTRWKIKSVKDHVKSMHTHKHMHTWQKINSREERTLLWENILGTVMIFNSKIGSTIYSQPAKLEIPSQQKNIQGQLQRVSQLLLNKISVLVLLLGLLPKLKLSRSSGREQKKNIRITT